MLLIVGSLLTPHLQSYYTAVVLVNLAWLMSAVGGDRDLGSRVIHHILYRCSPRHPPHTVPVLATSSTTHCTGARHVIHHILYRCSPHHPPHSVPVFSTSSTTP